MGFKVNGYYTCKCRLGENLDDLAYLEERVIITPDTKKRRNGLLCHAKDCENVACCYNFDHYENPYLAMTDNLLTPPPDALTLVKGD